MNGNDKRLVANTAILYLRMLLVMGLSFLTTRILLNAFGIDDFGLAWPLSYCALRQGYDPTAPFWIVLLLTVLTNVAQGAVALRLLRCAMRR